MNKASSLLGPVSCASEAAVQRDVHIAGELQASMGVVHCSLVSELGFGPVLFSDKLMLIKWL